MKKETKDKIKETVKSVGVKTLKLTVVAILEQVVSSVKASAKK